MGSLHSPAELKVTGQGFWVERETRGERIFVQNNFQMLCPVCPGSNAASLVSQSR